MKKQMIVLVIMCFSLTLIAQNKTQYRQPAAEKVIPKIVTATFKAKYPDAMVFTWYVTHISYWYEDYSGSWYTGWYPQTRPVVVYTYAEPAYYEVEFSTEPGEMSRAIFNRYGYWFETRTKLSGLPRSVVQSLQSSKYEEWKLSNHKEKIEAPGMPGSVYRVMVSKGIRSIILRFDDLGQIIQAKEEDYMKDGNPESNKQIREKNKKSKNK